MNIAMIGQKGMPAIHGGVERHVHELSVRLVERGHKVTAYSRAWYTGGKDEPIDGVTITHVPTIHTKHLDTITYTFMATLHAMRKKYDVIHYHGVGPALLSFLPRLFTPQIRVVTTFHSIDRKHEKWGLLARTALKLGERAACTFAHQTIAVSRTIQQYVRDAYSRDVHYVPNGVPMYDRSEKREALKKWNLTTGQYIIMVSRLIPHKGAHYLIAAYQKLQETNPELMKDKKLVIVGDGYYTDEYVSYLKQMSEGNKDIIFTGFQHGESLAELFSHAALMVHPSNNEGLPITVLEGMSYGLPILVSDIPEHRELIHQSKYNFVRSDVGSLKRKLEARLQESEESRTIVGEANRAVIAKEFAWEHIVKDIEKVYSSTQNSIISDAIPA